MSKMPHTWVLTDLGAIRADKTASFDPRSCPDEQFDLYSIPAFPSGLPEVVRGAEVGSTKRLLSPGTVVVSKINPRINRVWVVGEERGCRQIGSGEWTPFAPVEGIDPSYLAYYLRQDAFRNYLAANVSGVGGSLMRVRPTVLDPFPLVIPPPAEQQRIVEAIESYLTRLDDAVANLERVQRNLKRYSASVFKAAVEGRLVPTETELARTEGRAFEPAPVQLERILVERRRRWKEAGGRGQYVEPAAPNTSDLPELPEGWCWANIGQIGDVTGGLTKNAKREQHEFRLPYLRVANVYANELRLDEISHIGLSQAEAERTQLRRGDLLVVEGNGSADQIGRVAIWDGSVDPCVHQNHIIKVRFAPAALGSWSLRWLLSPAGRVHIQKAASSTSGLHTLSISKIARLPIPLPPCAEQVRIVDAAESLLSRSETSAATARINTRRCARLRQAILQWAFEGKLADQDPSDEPAAKLLERIRAERQAATPPTRGKPTRGRPLKPRKT